MSKTDRYRHTPSDEKINSEYFKWNRMRGMGDNWYWADNVKGKFYKYDVVNSRDVVTKSYVFKVFDHLAVIQEHLQKFFGPNAKNMPKSNKTFFYVTRIELGRFERWCLQCNDNIVSDGQERCDICAAKNLLKRKHVEISKELENANMKIGDQKIEITRLQHLATSQKAEFIMYQFCNLLG